MFAFIEADSFRVKAPIAVPTCARESRGELRGRVGILAASNSAGLGTNYPGPWKRDVILVCS
jgi:hypothetical protein